MSGLFSKLKQISFQQNAANSSREAECVESVSYKDDVEEDGYLLVDVTGYGEVSHTSTMDADQANANCLVPDELQSYKLGPVDEESAVLLRVTHFTPNSEDTKPSEGQRSPVSDIPFKLHPHFEAEMHAGSLFNDLNLKPHLFDWSKHSYDFTSERLSLRDMNSNDTANIDEFLTLSVP